MLRLLLAMPPLPAEAAARRVLTAVRRAAHRLHSLANGPDGHRVDLQRGGRVHVVLLLPAGALACLLMKIARLLIDIPSTTPL